MSYIAGSVLHLGLSLGGVGRVFRPFAGLADGWEHVDPELRWGVRGGWVLGGVIGLGLAGFSVVYTTLPDALTVVGAVLGAVALIAVSRFFGPSATV
jgi:hypothetical protein